ncbi:MAG: hypothetical protein ABL921_02845 [Pirellula sp.]
MTAATLLVASIAIAVCGWVFRDSSFEFAFETAQPAKPRTAALPMTTSDSLLVANDENVWNRPLQVGFREKPPKPSTLPAIESVPSPIVSLPRPASLDLGLRLVGTVLETGRSMAIAIDQKGKLDFRNEGEPLQLEPAGVRIDAVAAKSVRVTYQGKSVEWGLGQSLSIASEPNALIQPSVRLTPQPTSKKMSIEIEEELDRINRVPSDPP